jgi:hypothetical protein
MLDLSPVSAAAEHVQLNVGDERISRSEFSSGMTSSSRPCTTRVGSVSAASSSSAVIIASTHRWRGAGNMAANDSCTPGWMLVR